MEQTFPRLRHDVLLHVSLMFLQVFSSRLTFQRRLCSNKPWKKELGFHSGAMAIFVSQPDNINSAILWDRIWADFPGDLLCDRGFPYTGFPGGETAPLCAQHLCGPTHKCPMGSEARDLRTAHLPAALCGIKSAVLSPEPHIF